MEILKEIKDWRSIRFFENQKIEKEKILCILEAGRLAPSWQNLQPWHFLALENEDEKKEISKLIVTRKMTERAPLLIVILGNMEGFDMGIAKKRIKEQVGDKMSDEQMTKYLNNKKASPVLNSHPVLLSRLLEQVSYASSFMTLEARHQGLGVCIVGGIENNLSEKSEKYDEVKKILNIPEHYDILTVLCVGYENETVEKRSRKDLKEIASFGAFGKAE